MNTNRYSIFLFFLAMVFSACLPVRSEIHYVDLNNLSPEPPYVSWDAAATNIQDAVDVAAENDTVLVADGIYGLTTQIVVSNSITLRSVNGSDAAIIDGGTASRCFFLTHSNIVVDGFTIANGVVTGDHGGGLYLQFPATIMNCLVTNNSAMGTVTNTYGGGLYALSSATITNCTFLDNSVVGGARSIGAGGGAFLADSSLIQDCIFDSNHATGGRFVFYGVGDYNDAGAGKGGALYMQHAGMISDCCFTDNRVDGGNGMDDYWEYGGFEGAAPGLGGAVFLDADGTMVGCRFEGNRAHGGQPEAEGQGGAVYLVRSGSVSNSTFYRNTALGSGGGLYSLAGTGWGGAIYSQTNGTITHCDVRDNLASGGAGAYVTDGHAYGGGIYLETSNTVDHCNVYSNQAIARSDGKTEPGDGNAFGGGVHCGTGSLVLDSIVMWNEAVRGGTGNSYGGGVYLSETNTMDDTTVGLNTADEGPDVYPEAWYPPYDPQGDHDLDGLPNYWEMTYCGYINEIAAGEDTDEDGDNNLCEYIAGTNPLDATSMFRISISQESVPSTGGTIIWSANAGRLYDIYWTPGLTNEFQLLEQDISFPANCYTDKVHAVEQAGFYQVKVRLAE